MLDEPLVCGQAVLEAGGVVAGDVVDGVAVLAVRVELAPAAAVDDPPAA